MTAWMANKYFRPANALGQHKSTWPAESYIFHWGAALRFTDPVFGPFRVLLSFISLALPCSTAPFLICSFNLLALAPDCSSIIDDMTNKVRYPLGVRGRSSRIIFLSARLYLYAH